MANENNLISFDKRTESEQREIAKKGGIKSGQVRREKRTVQEILKTFLSSDIKSTKALEKLAKSIGLENSTSIKELVTVTLILNTLQKGNVSELEKLCRILGEDNSIERVEDLSEPEADIFGD